LSINVLTESDGDIKSIPLKGALMEKSGKISLVSIIIRPDDTGSLRLVEKIMSLLENNGIRSCLPDLDIHRDLPFSRCVSDDIKTGADLAVVIGGDGTFLRAARMFAGTETPLFGINRGRLGFLTEFYPDESMDYLEKYIARPFPVTARTLLLTEHYRDGVGINSVLCLNDAVISKGAFSRSIRLRLELDGRFLNCYSGDGLIISSPTGSTAYSLSAGGPIVTPAIDNVYLLNPICPHTLAIRPMIIPSASVLSARIVSELKNLLLTIDGQEAISIEGNDELRFRGSDKKILLVPHPDRDYNEILRVKLGWGKNLNE